jgi:hypothetical protein
LTLTIVATGESPTYQWSQDGTNIVDATDATYTKVNVTRADSGSYVCAVTSGTTTNSDPAVVTVIDPAINIQPADLIVATHSNAVFTLSAGGTAPLTYKWLKTTSRGTTALIKDTAAIKGTGTASLTLVNVSQAGAGGTYTCIVSNGPTTTVTSDPKTLTVWDAPKVTVIPPTHTLWAGQNFTLKSLVTLGARNQTVSYQWYKDGVLLSGSTNATYAIVSPEPDAAGIYEVVVNNNSGVSATNHSVITVTPDSSAPHTLLIMSPKALPPTKPALTNGMPITDATTTNKAPQIEVLAKFIDPHGLLVSGYITNLTTHESFTGDFCVSQTDLTHTNANYGKPAYYHATVLLQDGTNEIQAVATDYGTNSASSKSSFYYYMGQPATCVITNNGTGHVGAKVMDKIWGLPTPAPITTAPTLEIGHQYSIAATATGLHVTFAGWDLSDTNAQVSVTPGRLPTQSTLTFIMKTNLTIGARYSNGQ